MASAILHIKDSYYFEVPKFLLPRKYTDKSQFPDVWVKLDDQFQEVEFDNLYHQLEHIAEDRDIKIPSHDDAHHGWHDWMHHDHANHGKPFDVYLEEHAEALNAEYKTWLAKPETAKRAESEGKTFEDFLVAVDAKNEQFAWFARLYNDSKFRHGEWAKAKKTTGGKEAIAAFKADSKVEWSEQKLAFYNHHLSGKILIPQPFGELRNFYQPESGFCLSKFMILEVVVGLILLLVFSWVARRIATGEAPKGKAWNLLETFLVFIRDQVAAPAIGGDHHDEHDHAIEHDAHGHALAKGSHAIHADAGEELSPHAHGHGHHKTTSEISDEKRFTPYLWTVFFFVLGCNLFGMVPWAGSPTASFSVTLALAFLTFSAVVVGGMRKFGFLGFFKNQVPSMDLPIYIAVVLVPGIFAIEMLGLLIKHGVLAIRLLANMVAGHLVILAIMGLAFGASAAASFSGPNVPSWQWPVAATISVLGSTLFNVLELFVAFLQAYVFTFLSALFIGASVHKH